ncbi:Bpu10I family restriction endonuclease [Segatella copri]|uniref:Bpu10I family restriction endonuclease n=1 Tax=Segatella copri TaxID=165179 RepID=UPI003F9574D8
MYYKEDFCNHKRNLLDYLCRLKRDSDIAIFTGIKEAYEQYRQDFDNVKGFSDESISQMVKALNDYRKKSVPYFDKLDNSGQKALGYTIMEEFFYLFFQKYVSSLGIQNDNLFLGKGNSYVSLSFTPKSFAGVLENVNPYIHSKDQDFVLGISVDINVKSGNTETIKNTILPVVAIECKTYLEKNMLDSCANTATRLKNAMPYCIYMVASEYMKMDAASPELTDIDEVYILCKAKNSERLKRNQQGLPPLDIDAELIMDIYHRVKRHLNSVWWNPQDAIVNGKVICRP